LRRAIGGRDAQKVETPTRPLRILIADDHPLIRCALRHDLERGGLEVCADVPTGAEAVQAALRERPDLCLLDVQMPHGGGIAAAVAIRRSLPATKIVLITADPDEDGVLAAARAGADGYWQKTSPPAGCRRPYARSPAARPPTPGGCSGRCCARCARRR
jgi:DNA-binding NarL/FixJ family response regulator